MMVPSVNDRVQQTGKQSSWAYKYKSLNAEGKHSQQFS